MTSYSCHDTSNAFSCIVLAESSSLKRSDPKESDFFSASMFALSWLEHSFTTWFSHR